MSACSQQPVNYMQSKLSSASCQCYMVACSLPDIVGSPHHVSLPDIAR